MWTFKSITGEKSEKQVGVDVIWIKKFEQLSFIL